MPLITVNQGGPDIEAGVYTVILTGIDGPKTIIPQSGVNAGKEVSIFDWTFAVDEGEYEGTEIQATTSVSSGPRSKMYAFLTALLDGKAPAVGASFEATDLVGRRALATISRSESGWPRVENLGALPKAMRPTVAPKPATSSLRTQVVEPAADLPF